MPLTDELLVDEMKNWLEETPISTEAKNKLFKKSLELNEQLKPIIRPREERAKVSLTLACDENLCAIPQKIPQPKMKFLSEARKATGIKNVEAIQRIDMHIMRRAYCSTGIIFLFRQVG